MPEIVFSVEQTEPAVIFHRPRPPIIEAIRIDACVEEQHSLTNTVTDHPVESGSAISDHVRPEPDKVQLHCFVSNTPISKDAQSRVTASQGVLDPDEEPHESPGYAEEALTTLRGYREKGTLLSIGTSLGVYGDMVIESISIPRTAKVRDALEFTVNFRRIRVVINKLVKVVIAKDTRAQKKRDKGDLATKEETEVEVESKANEALNSGLDLAKKFL